MLKNKLLYLFEKIQCVPKKIQNAIFGLSLFSKQQAQKSSRPKHRLLRQFGYRKWKEFFSLFLLLCICTLYTHQMLVKNQKSFSFYQTEFSPAIMYACGYSFSNPIKEEHINDFLTQKSNHINCQLIDGTKVQPLTFFQSVEKYLILSAGVIWKILGISWENLIPLFLVMYSASIAAIYFLFRLGMRCSLSFVFTLIIALSSFHMTHLLQLRDYSVAPFLLWTVWLTAKCVINNLSLKKKGVNCYSNIHHPEERVTKNLYDSSGNSSLHSEQYGRNGSQSPKKYFLCACAGILLGIGLGFRSDLLILIPYFILTVLLFVKRSQNIFVDKIFPILTFFICFLIFSYPILHVLTQAGGNLSHVIILGLSDEFTQSLSLQKPETYSIIPYYRDLIPYTMLNSFAERMDNLKHLLLSPSKGYDHYGNLFLLNYVYYYPADVLIRIYASIHQILILPFQGHSGILFSGLNKTGVVFPVLALILIAFYQLRLALFILFSLIYLCAYPVLQFAPRHYFYLDFIGWWFVGFLLEVILLFSKDAFFRFKNIIALTKFQGFLFKYGAIPLSVWIPAYAKMTKNYSCHMDFSRAHIKSLIQARWRIVCSTTAMCILFIYILLLGARAYQNSILITLYTQYINLPEAPLLTTEDLNKGTFRVSLPTKIQHLNAPYLETFYIKIATKSCSENNSVLKLHYLEKPDINWMAPDEIKIPTDKEGVYFFPIYNFHNPGPTVINECALPSYWIDAIEYPLTSHSCIKSINLVTLNNTPPFLLYLNLQNGWEKSKLYQDFKI